MSTSTILYLNDYNIFSTRSTVDSEVMTVFTESDRQVLRRRATDGTLINGIGDDGDDVTLDVQYVVAAEAACRRLEVMGFTLSRCKSEYEEVLSDKLKRAREHLAEVEAIAAERAGQARLARGCDDGPAEASLLPGTWYRAQIRLLESLSFEDYGRAFKRLSEEGLQWFDIPQDVDINSLSLAEQYILDDHHDEWPFFGFFCHDVRSFLRFAISTAEPGSSLRQDVSALIESGCAALDDPLRDSAVAQLLDHYPVNAPKIVLTEGKSDAVALEKTLQLLFPELVGYYTFFDFHGVKAGGGASQLVSVVKAFVAAGVANYVIAVLDNDSAAHEATKALKNKLPPNIKLLHYPDRVWLQSYAAAGPKGGTRVNVNGCAGNLEMYMGPDILCIDGLWEPITWGGPEVAPQGALTNKGDVSARWLKKARACLTNEKPLVPHDWEDMRAIWEAIFVAFNDERRC